MTSTTITKTVFFNAKPSQIWEYLTRAEKLSLWLNPIENDLQENADYVFYKTNESGHKAPLIWGSVVDMEKPLKLTYTFVIDAFNGNESVVNWQLDEAAGGTRLTLTHSGIAGAAKDAALSLLSALDKGWDEHFSVLRKLNG